MDAIFQWIVDLNRNDHVSFGLLTVASMSGIGVLIAFVAEMVFAALGIRSDRIDIQH